MAHLIQDLICHFILDVLWKRGQRPIPSSSCYEYFIPDIDDVVLLCICAFNTEVAQRPDFIHRIVVKSELKQFLPIWSTQSQLTCSSSRSSIWRSCSCTCCGVDPDRPFSCSSASTSSPLPPRCNSSQQLDSSEVEHRDASSDSKDDDEYDLTMIVIVVCGRLVMFGDLRVA